MYISSLYLNGLCCIEKRGKEIKKLPWIFKHWRDKRTKWNLLSVSNVGFCMGRLHACIYDN